jgi:hypothetical protein
MKKRTRSWPLATLLISLFLLAGCAPAPELEERDVNGIWSYEEGGTVTFEDDRILIDDLAIDPIDGTGFDEHFSGTGTWKINDKPYVYFTLNEWTRRSVASALGKTYESSFQAVQRDGELQLEIYYAAQDIRYILTKN